MLMEKHVQGVHKLIKSHIPSPTPLYSLRGDFRSHHQSRTGPPPLHSLVSEVTSEATIKVAQALPHSTL